MWKVYVDGEQNHKGVGLGLAIFLPYVDIAYRSVRCGFPAMNNVAEYKAMLLGLDTARELGARKVIIHSDSQLVINQIQGTYEAKDSRMEAYVNTVKRVVVVFDSYEIQRIRRGENNLADALAKLGSSLKVTPEEPIHVVWLQHPHINTSGRISRRYLK